ncbi:trypsin-like serine protease [Geodermatophilus sp. SYSU D00867]
MWKTVTTAALASAMLLAGGTAAQAITGKSTEDFEHEYVGLAVFFDAEGDPGHRCSGSLLTDTVFLTAGHCVTLDDEGTVATRARVYFEQDVQALGPPVRPAAASSRRRSTPTATQVWATSRRPRTPATGPRRVDRGVGPRRRRVRLAGHRRFARQLRGGTPRPLGHHDGLGPRRAGEQRQPDRERLTAESSIVGPNGTNAGGYNVSLSTNPGNGRGGTCFGDSGGPVLVGDTVTAVNSFVMNGACAGTGFGYRVDQQPFLDWLQTTVSAEWNEIEFVTL